MKIQNSFAKLNDFKRIKKFFTLLDNEFFPKLSERKHGEDLDSLLKKSFGKGNIGIAEIDNNIVAVCTYWIEEEKATITATGVSKQFRGTPILYNLSAYMLEKEKGKPIKKIRVKTWSSNSKTKMILKKIGFRKMEIIREDLHKNRISEIYEIDFDLLKSYFGIPKHNSS